MSAASPANDVTTRIERAEAASRAMLDGLAGDPGDAHATFAGITAFVSRSIPNTFFNRAIGLSETDASLVPAVAEWYRRRGVPPRFDLAPTRAGKSVRGALSREGLTLEQMPGLTRRLMAGLTSRTHSAAPELPDGVEIIEAVGRRLEEFLDIQMQTWPEDGGARTERLDRLRRTAAAPGLMRFVALADGEPAATAALHLIDGVGWLSSGATLQSFRGRGIQLALIRHRLNQALAHGADLVGTLVAPHSGSERNVLRCGLRHMCDRELWLPPDWTDHPFYRGAG